jgi:hypothetical protein
MYENVDVDDKMGVRKSSNALYQKDWLTYKQKLTASHLGEAVNGTINFVHNHS